ncbi:MAG: diguanylate cyclase [Planctomycetes bacterium]|nr:diguanylate cyclase [Planctomycetota bacterium]
MRFLAGLLADIGRLAMLKTIAKQYLPVLEAAEDGLRELHELEQEILGFDHIEVGLELMRSWELPEPLVLSAALHHADLEQLQAKADDSYASLLQAVATSAAIGEYFCGYGKGQALQRAKRFTQEFYGFSEEDLNEFIEQTSARIEEAGQLFSMNTSSIPDPSELLARANEQLAQLAMRAHVESQQAKARERSIEEEKKRLESENRELQQQAVHDPLTEVYNRRFFDETLSREIARARREATPVALLFIDIDHFKQINDTYGHHCGDLVLQRVAKLIDGILRSSDVLARYGGEEFTILINQPTEKGIGKLAERIRQRVEQEEIIVEGQRIPVTVSIGAAIALPQRHETDLASRLVAAADEAMYDSKRGGRNQVHVRSLIQEPERRLMQRVTQHRFSRWLVDRGLFDIPTVSKALAYCRPEPVRIGQLAQQHGYLTDAEVEQILQTQESTGERFGAAAVRLGLLREDELVHLLAQQREDAAKLARTLVQMGLLDQRRAEALLREYITERSPRRVAGPIATPAQAR